jgi:hypothetical protein
MNHRDWIDFANAAGSIATALTLIYLVYKEWKTRKDITDMGIIAAKIAEQTELAKLRMKIEVTPRFTTPDINTFGNGSIQLKIYNDGQPAIIKEVLFDQSDFRLKWNRFVDFPKLRPAGIRVNTNYDC